MFGGEVIFYYVCAGIIVNRSMMTVVEPEQIDAVVHMNCSVYVATSLEQVIRFVDHVHMLLQADLRHVTLQFQQLTLDTEHEDRPTLEQAVLRVSTARTTSLEERLLQVIEEREHRLMEFIERKVEEVVWN